MKKLIHQSSEMVNENIQFLSLLTIPTSECD